MAADVGKILRLYDELRSSKSDFSDHLEDIAAVMLPRRMGFAGGSEARGNRLNDELFDSTPQQAARGLASAIGTTTRPDGQKWFFIRADDDEINRSDEAIEWFDATEKRLVARAFENPKSRFRQAMGEADLDLVTFGTAVVFAGERTDIGGLRYESIGLKNVFIVTDENGLVNGLIRKHMLTPRQAVGLFGEKNVSKTTKELIEKGNHKEKIEHIHVVVPREERNIGPINQRFQFTSIWIEVQSKELILESGFQEFPYVVARFDTTSGEDWGRGPGMVALPDANMLQAMDETILIAGQKTVEPPLLVPDDGTFNAANTFAGGLSYYDSELAREMGRIPIEPLNMGSRIDIGLEMQQDRRSQVMRAFFAHVLNLPVDGPEMTATEVIKRDQEFMREMGGLFGRLESDYIAPIVERTFNVMLRAGALPPIPDALLGQNVRFEFESPLRKVRQQIEAAAARNWKDDLILMAAQGRPEVLDRINVDEYARFQAEANSVPLRIINNDDTVQDIREQRAQAQQAAQQLEIMNQMAEAEEKGSKALKNVNAS